MDIININNHLLQVKQSGFKGWKTYLFTVDIIF